MDFFDGRETYPLSRISKIIYFGYCGEKEEKEGD